MQVCFNVRFPHPYTIIRDLHTIHRWIMNSVSVNIVFSFLLYSIEDKLKLIFTSTQVGITQTGYRLDGLRSIPSWGGEVSFPHNFQTDPAVHSVS